MTRRKDLRAPAVAVGIAAAALATSPAFGQSLEAPKPDLDPPAAQEAPRVDQERPSFDQRPSLEAPSAPSPDAAPDEEAVRLEAGKEAEAAAAVEDERRMTPEERLERAFEKLSSEDEAEWRDAQQEIGRAWSRSGSASADLLLRRGRDAMEREDWTEAQRHFDDLVNLAPDFAEGWNMRATLHFQQDDFGRSLADIAETLAREPRHFGAIAGLGVILETLDRNTEAMAAYRRALEIHPNLENAKEAVKRLGPKAQGREI